jgi:hypothetical protein
MMPSDQAHIKAVAMPVFKLSIGLQSLSFCFAEQRHDGAVTTPNIPNSADLPRKK